MVVGEGIEHDVGGHLSFSNRALASSTVVLASAWRVSKSWPTGEEYTAVVVRMAFVFLRFPGSCDCFS